MWVGVPIIFTGFSLGSFYALIALGFSLILGVARAFNLAHGEMIVLSGYLAYMLWQFFQVPFFWILPICSVVLLGLMLLLLAVAKRYREAQEIMKSRRVGLPKTVRVDGKTLALIGVGSTGTEFARLARGFGLNVIAVKQTRDAELQKRLDLQFLGDVSNLL